MSIREENKKVQDNMNYRFDKDKMQEEMLMAKLTKMQKAAIKKKKKIADLSGEAIDVKEIVTDDAFKAIGNKKEPATAQEVNMYLKELLDKEFPEVTGPTRSK